ncbi:carbohydrate ABC transporter permease [Leadbettera azotonutricia]|uniref:ABC transporter, permease protein n=1 Tax=Leadbettera azotonutricia (strain ATCC BAA-888 / DSM 13862 / ZAS-9) TaxID=545695 RepID=F5Y9Y0_LEAAZ|nr:sugar ABC transporter permease [Leadbettera azotonutricia]AEF81280.1 ABC transporter, permease protein [Leadbettera azotonutricia ZAS-9]
MNKLFQKWGYIFAFPAVAVVTFMFIVPMFRNIYLSLFESDGLSVMRFVGFGNYINMFKDSNFVRSIFNSVLWVVFTIVFSVGVGLLIAVFVNGIKGENFFKSVFFMPLTISFVSVGAIWWYMYSKEYGVLNQILLMVGFKTKIDWLYKMPLNNISLLIAWSWQQLGVNLVMFLMGLTSIPSEQIEASRIDGCNKWQTFIHITFPMLKPITTVVVGMAIVNSFKAFDLIYIMTRGGPVRSSETLAVNMFVESFQRNHQGFGAAIGVFLTLLILPITAIYMRATSTVDHADNK